MSLKLPRDGMQLREANARMSSAGAALTHGYIQCQIMVRLSTALAGDFKRLKKSF